jgi:O-antigen/teichoic acid export membrane protein
MKELARGIKINILGNVFRLSRAAFFFVAVYLYGAEKFGIYTIAWAAAELVILFGILGLDQGLLFELAHFKNKQEYNKLYQKIASSLKACLCVSLLEVFLLTTYSYLYVEDHNIKVSLFLLIPFLPLYSISTLMIVATMGLKEMKYNAIIRSSLEPMLMLTMLIVYKYSPWDEYGIILAQCTAMFVTSLLCLHAFGKFFSWSLLFKACRKRGRYILLLRYSLPMYLVDIVDNTLYRSDIFIMSAILGTGTPEQKALIGVYGIAKQIARVATQTKKAFGPIFISVTSESHLEEDHRNHNAQVLYATEKILLLNIALGLFLVFFGKEIIDLFIKDAAIITNETFLWLVAGQLAYSTFSLPMYSLINTGSYGRFLILNIAVLGLAAMLGSLAVEKWQAYGAALTLGLAYLIISAASIFETLHSHARAFIQNRALIIMAAGVVAALTTYLIKAWFPVIITKELTTLMALLPSLILFFWLASLRNKIVQAPH